MRPVSSQKVPNFFLLSRSGEGLPSLRPFLFAGPAWRKKNYDLSCSPAPRVSNTYILLLKPCQAKNPLRRKKSSGQGKRPYSAIPVHTGIPSGLAGTLAFDKSPGFFRPGHRRTVGTEAATSMPRSVVQIRACNFQQFSPAGCVTSKRSPSTRSLRAFLRTRCVLSVKQSHSSSQSSDKTVTMT
jgi:hypothetical protein